MNVRTHQQLADAYQRTRGELERLADLLAGRREDRPAANQRFRSAAEVLDQLGLDLSQPHGDWVRMLDQVRGAAADLEQADRLAREDIRLAGQAQSEIDDASRAVEQARQAYAMGVWADTAAADAALERARQLVADQQYEQAVECAGQAQREARRAHQEAVQQASWREMQAGAQRRQWQAPQGGGSLGDALLTGAAVAAGAILENVMRGVAQSGTPEPPPGGPAPVYSQEPEVLPSPPADWEGDTGQEPEIPDSPAAEWEGDTGQDTW